MISSGSRTISTCDISSYLSEEEILEFYTGISDLPLIVPSPLRPDKNPSFSLSVNEHGLVRFYDFGTDESGGLYDILMILYKMSFSEVLNMVYDEMIDGKDIEKKVRINAVYERKIKPRIDDLKVKVREWRDYDVKFWSSFGVNNYWLQFGDIYPVSRMFIYKGGEEMIIPCEKYAYVYVEFKDDRPTYKIYQPFSDKFKWINMHDKSVWDLWSKLPTHGDKLIITSSRKDSLCLWANLNIPSICLQAESTGPKEHVVYQLIERFRNIYILYDNDFKSEKNWGRINGEKLSSKFNFKQIEIPMIYQSKDPSDLFRNHGEKVFKEILNKLLND